MAKQSMRLRKKLTRTGEVKTLTTPSVARGVEEIVKMPDSAVHGRILAVNGRLTSEERKKMMDALCDRKAVCEAEREVILPYLKEDYEIFESVRKNWM